MEVIHVRLYNQKNANKIMETLSRIRESFAVHTHLYRDAFLDSDWAIHVESSAAPLRHGKSPEANCLTDLLRGIGLVNHTVWVPVSSDTVKQGVIEEPCSKLQG